MKVRDLCRRAAVSVSAAAPLIEAARLMCDHCIGTVVVTERVAGKPLIVGIVTDRDIVITQLNRAADLSQFRVADAMTRDPLVLPEDEAIDTAIRSMRDRTVRRAPVAAADGTLVGVLSFDDLLAHLAGDLTALARVTNAQPAPQVSGYQI